MSSLKERTRAFVRDSTIGAAICVGLLAGVIYAALIAFAAYMNMRGDFSMSVLSAFIAAVAVYEWRRKEKGGI